LVGQLYPIGDERRDSGYTLYYMGINIGSIIGYLVCGWLQVNIGYHWAFGAAAVGMGAGLIQFRLSIGKLGDRGANPTVKLSLTGLRRSKIALVLVAVLITSLTSLVIRGDIVINPVSLAQYVALLITVVFLSYYAAIYLFTDLTSAEKKSLGALFLICLASTFFWAGFEQAGSSLNLFGRDYTDRIIGNFEVPPAWFQSANSFFIVLLSPFFAALWINLTKRMINPSYGIKCAVGLIIMAAGFVVMFFAAQVAASGLQAAPYWLIATYFLHTVGELCLSPVALSAVSKLSPKRFAGR